MIRALTIYMAVIASATVIRADGPTYIENENTKCILCHSAGAIPPKDTTGIGKRVTLKEATIWQMHDKHAKAFEALEKPLGQAMSQLLGYDVRRDTRCLNCHVGTCQVEEPATPAKLTAPPEALVAGGVGCQACHGPAANWVNVHQDPSWLKKTTEERRALGLRETREPVARAEMCVSCHLGNAAERKQVTHDMYAAGHPPLPGFEIETFTKIMPTHAKPLAERTDLLERLKLPVDELPQTRATLTASVVAMRSAIKLLADGAAPQTATGKSEWPEFALFDCAACHHELRMPSWRQGRGSLALPGRPTVRSWPLALYRVVDRDAVRTLKPLQQTLDRQPFGRPVAVRLAAQEVLLQVDAKLADLQAQKFDQTSGTKWLKRICDVALEGTHDYESARQLAWVFLVVFRESAAGQQEKIEAILKQLESELHLAIDSEAVLKNTDETLRAASAYSPQAFQAHFRNLSQLLGE